MLLVISQSIITILTFNVIQPIYIGSAGKGKNYQNSSLGNRELYAVLYFLAIQQVHIDKKGNSRNPEMRAYFEYKISTGKTKIQALLCIMRRLIRIIYAMMKYQIKYEMPKINEKEEKVS